MLPQDEHADGSPSADSSTPDNEGVGQEQRHPDEVAAIEKLRHQEAVYRRILADRHQQIRFDEHDRCLLRHEASEEIKDQDEGEDEKHHLVLIIGSGYPS